MNPKTLFKKDIKNETGKKTQDRCVEDNMVEKAGPVVDAAYLLVGKKMASPVSTKSSLGLEASGDNRKEALSNSEPLRKLPVARAGRISLPPGDDSTEKMMEAKD